MFKESIRVAFEAYLIATQTSYQEIYESGMLQKVANSICAAIAVSSVDMLFVLSVISESMTEISAGNYQWVSISDERERILLDAAAHYANEVNEVGDEEGAQ